MQKYQVFISYRRDGGEHAAKIVRDALTEKGYHVFFDVESLRSGNFNTALYNMIDECSDFVVILSPGALDRCVSPDDWVRREIEYALTQNKNIVPILLRGFKFPEKLPESIDELRYQSGLEANTQYFDAFTDTLTQKFLTHPNKKIKRIVIPAVSLLIALIAVCGVLWNVNTAYPRTNSEKSLVEEVLSATMKNLTDYDLLTGYMNDVLSAGNRYLNANGQDENGLRERISRSLTLMEQIDFSDNEIPADLMERMTDSCLSGAELREMTNILTATHDEYLNDIAYIYGLLLNKENATLSSADKIEILEGYQTIISENAKAYVYNANLMLLPVSDSALKTFLYQYLPTITSIDYTPSMWSRNEDELNSLWQGCEEKAQKSLIDISVKVGELRNRSLDDIIKTLKTNSDLTAADLYTLEAEDLRIRIDRALKKGEDTLELSKRRLWWVETAGLYPIPKSVYFSPDKLIPTGTDTGEEIYLKTVRAFGLHYDGLATDCIAFWKTNLTDAGDANELALLDYMESFIANAGSTGIRYGVMITGYDPNDPRENEVFRIGDVIVSFNGRECHVMDEYMEWKNALEALEYEVVVLRRNSSGEWEEHILNLTTDMPKVALRDVSVSLQHVIEAELYYMQ